MTAKKLFERLDVINLTSKALFCVGLCLSMQSYGQSAAPLTQAPASAATASDAGTVENPLGGVYTRQSKANPKLARVVVYRVQDAKYPGVASLRVNSHYHTSLQPGAFSELCFAPMETWVTARYVETGLDAVFPTDTSEALKIKAGQSVFLRVRDLDEQHFELSAVEPREAEKELTNTRRQLHAVTRVPQAEECDEKYADSKTDPAGGYVITLSADALFGFGKVDAASIPPKKELDELVKRIQTRYGSFENTRIHVVGHADPIGSPLQNQKTSQARAMAVREYMIQRGLPANSVTSEGVGDTQLIVKTCGRSPTQESIACNKPNRRVVVDVRVQTGS